MANAQRMAGGKRLAQAVLFIVLIAALSSLAIAQSVPMPQGIMGTVYELDGITEAPAGTSFSVNNTVNGFFYQGTTGRGPSSGAYAVALTGATGNSIAIRAWNRDHWTERNVSLSGVMKNVNLLLNMSLSNTAPVITSVPVTTATEDAPYAYGVTATDWEGDNLTFSLVVSPAGMSINATSGSIAWLPSNSEVGSHQVSVMVSDGKLNATQGFTLTVENVNDAPVITSVPPTDATEDMPYEYQAAASDPDNATLSYALLTAPAGMAISSTGLVSWLPGDGDVGVHNVTLTVSDGIATTEQNFTLTVENVNDAPVIASVPPTDATEDVPYEYQAAASDPDNATLSYALLTAPAGMAISSIGLVSWLPGDGDVGVHNVTLEVSDGIAVASQNYLLTVTNVNDAPVITSVPPTDATEDVPYEYQAAASDPDNATLSYALLTAPAGMAISSTGLVIWLPGNDDVGVHNVTLMVSDGIASAEQGYLLTVENVNDAPSIYSIPPTDATEDSPYGYQVDASDADNATLSYTLVSAPAGMTLSTEGLVGWLPGNDDVGVHNVTLMVSDGIASAEQGYLLTVENVNDAPLILTLADTHTLEDELYEYDVNASDADTPQGGLAYSLVLAPAGMSIDASTGAISWLPENGDVGLHNVTVRVSDGELTDEQPYALIVENVNDAPAITSAAVTSVVEDEQYLYQVKAEDIDGDGLAYALLAAPAGMVIVTVNATPGLVMWLPGNDDVGVYNIIIEVSDGELTDAQGFTLIVENVNDAPVIQSIPPADATEDMPYEYQVSVGDPDNATLSYALVTAPAGMAVSSGGLVSWLPGNNDVGIHNVTLEVSDGIASAEQGYLLTVENVNDAPIITSVPPADATEDSPYGYQMNASDVDNTTLSYTLALGPAGMAISSSGLVSWLPGNSDVGTHNVTLEVSDGIISAEQGYLLIVENVNDAPAITSEPPTEVRAGELYLYPIAAEDPDNGTLSFSLEKAPSGMALAEGVVRWQPSAADIGDHQVIIAASDGALAARQTYVLTVLAQPAASGGGGSGGGGAPIVPPGKATFLVEVFTGKAGALISVNASVTSAKDRGAAALIEARSLGQRPEGILVSPDMPVYQYLDISVRPLGDEAVAVGETEIVFAVEKAWLDSLGAAPGSVVLVHWDGAGWQPLNTSLVEERTDSAIFRSRSPSLSVFAITLSQGTALAQERMLGEVEELAPPEESYSIGGVITSADGSQLWRGASFVLENLENGESIEGTTGIAGDSGRFSAQLLGASGDTVRLSVEGKEHLWFVMAGDRDTIEMRTALPAERPGRGLLTGFAARITPRMELSKRSLAGNALVVLLATLGVLLARRMISRQERA